MENKSTKSAVQRILANNPNSHLIFVDTVSNSTKKDGRCPFCGSYSKYKQGQLTICSNCKAVI